MSEPLVLTLEFVRTGSSADPYAFQFGLQEYLVRDRSREEYNSTSLDWTDGLLDLLERLQRPEPAPDLIAEVGRRLQAFLAPAGWRSYEEQIVRASQGERPIRIEITSAAAELYSLPWELMTLRSTGQQIGQIPGCLVVHRWPGLLPPATHSQPDGRTLVAWSAAGGAVPARAHIAAISRGAASGSMTFDPDKDVLADASLRRIDRHLSSSKGQVRTLHLLCHGTNDGLILDGEDDDEFVVADANRLQTMLAPYASQLALVVLCACRGGDAPIPTPRMASIAQAVHRAGVRSVIASRFPLSTSGSVTLAEELYGALSRDPQALDAAVLDVRRSLAMSGGHNDHMSVQLYQQARDHPPAPEKGSPRAQAHFRGSGLSAETAEPESSDLGRSPRRWTGIAGAIGLLAVIGLSVAAGVAYLVIPHGGDVTPVDPDPDPDPTPDPAPIKPDPPAADEPDFPPKGQFRIGLEQNNSTCYLDVGDEDPTATDGRRIPIFDCGGGGAKVSVQQSGSEHLVLTRSGGRDCYLSWYGANAAIPHGRMATWQCKEDAAGAGARVQFEGAAQNFELVTFDSQLRECRLRWERYGGPWYAHFACNSTGHSLKVFP